MNALELTGRARSHVIQLTDPRLAAHPEAAEAFLAMRRAAIADGFGLLPFSTFRDFDTQCRIWNHKFIGRKPLYDANGQPRDYSQLTPDEIIEAILNWSALPGASRHHWGTEFDVVDAAAMPPGYQVQLLPEESAPGGLFHPLHQWLDEHMAEFGFYRPYDTYRGGMYPEPWHLSYAAVSLPALEALTLDVVTDAVLAGELEGKDLLLPKLPEIYQRHVLNVAPVPQQ